MAQEMKPIEQFKRTKLQQIILIIEMIDQHGHCLHGTQSRRRYGHTTTQQQSLNGMAGKVLECHGNSFLQGDTVWSRNQGKVSGKTYVSPGSRRRN